VTRKTNAALTQVNQQARPARGFISSPIRAFKAILVKRSRACGHYGASGDGGHIFLIGGQQKPRNDRYWRKADIELTRFEWLLSGAKRTFRTSPPGGDRWRTD